MLWFETLEDPHPQKKKRKKRKKKTVLPFSRTLNRKNPIGKLITV